MVYLPQMPFSRFGTHPVSPRDERDHRIAAYLPGQQVLRAADLPAEVGSLNLELAPRIRQQGEEGSCTGHAFRTVKAVVEKRRRSTKQARARVPEFGPRGIYENAKTLGGYPEQEGAYMRDVVKAAEKYGTPREVDWPYVEGQAHKGTPNKSMAKNALHWRIGPYARLRTLDEMLTALHTVGPIFMAMELTDSFFEVGQDGVVPGPRGQSAGGHAMAFVLADQERKAFLTANNWGEQWGKGGYGWIGFDHFLAGAQSEAWALPDAA